MELHTSVKSYIQQQGLLERASTVVAAVSGGVDSLVMVDILYRLHDELNFSLVIANFNHKLRSEADEEAELVRAWAHRRGLPFYSGQADIAALSRGHNLQEVARRERYAFLRGVAYQQQQAVIATAHHRDDQAETVLLHLLRGSGPSGLAAMSPREGNLIRPLLAVSRAEIAAYATEQGVDYRDDASNFSSKYTRNRIRLELIPQLRSYNPQLSQALADTAEICRAEDALLAELTDIELAGLWSLEHGRLDGAGFSELGPALQRRVLRAAFCLVAGDKPELSFSQVEAIRSLKEGQSCTLPGARCAYRQSGDIYLARTLPEPQLVEQTWPLLDDGAWHQLDELPWRYQAAWVEQPPPWQPMQYALPQSAVASAWWRTRRAGDSVPSSSKSGRRKLKEIFIDAHLPRAERDLLPLLLCGEDIAWVPGLWQRPYGESGKWLLIKLAHCDKIY